MKNKCVKILNDRGQKLYKKLVKKQNNYYKKASQIPIEINWLQNIKDVLLNDEYEGIYWFSCNFKMTINNSNKLKGDTTYDEKEIEVV